MKFSTELEAGLVTAAKALISEYAGEIEHESLSEMEDQVQTLLQGVGRCVLSALLEKADGKYPAATVSCRCGGQARYVAKREGLSITLQGKVWYRRAYYGCACGRGQCPLDERLGIEPGRMSAAVKRVASLLGVQEGYATSSATLAQLCPLELSPNSVRAACHQAGEQVIAQEAALLEASQQLTQQTATQRQRTPPTQVYLSMDGFQAPFHDGWHELKAGVMWSVNATGQAHNQHYFVDTLPADGFANLVWAKAWQYGADLADRLVIIADGSAWIWRIAQSLFPNAIQILDWFHAASYLATIANDAFGDGSPDAMAWFDHHKTLLHDGHWRALIRACRAIRPKATAAVDAARRYFAHHRTRLRYPKFRALGLPIGSGVMESACKQLGLQRLKLSGARWSTDGARKLVKARAAFLSDKRNFYPFALPLVA